MNMRGGLGVERKEGSGAAFDGTSEAAIVVPSDLNRFHVAITQPAISWPEQVFLCTYSMVTVHCMRRAGFLDI